MRIRNEEDFWSGVMFLAIGAGFAVTAQRYGLGTLRSMGPGWFPTAVGSIMAVLGAVLAFKSLQGEKRIRIEPIGWRGLVAILGSLALFSSLLPYLGLVVTLSLLIFGSLLAGRDFNLRGALLITAVLVAMGWLIFVAGLGIQVQVWPVYFGGE